MTTQLVSVQPLVRKSVTPPPKRHEIISAMVKLRMTENIEFNKKRRIEEDTSFKALEKEVKRVAKLGNGSLRAYSYNSTDCSLELQISVRPTDVPSEALNRWLKAKHAPSKTTDEKVIRKQISAGLNGFSDTHDRVDAMLSDKATHHAFVDMLALIK